MNKKQFARVLSLWRDKVSEEICVCTIIELSGSNTEAAIFIAKFYNEVFSGLIKENAEFSDELSAWKKIERDLREAVRRLDIAELTMPTQDIRDIMRWEED